MEYLVWPFAIVLVVFILFVVTFSLIRLATRDREAEWYAEAVAAEAEHETVAQPVPESEPTLVEARRAG